ncbi:2',3'-cyclic-nucleotide 3'-phosphodiesterase [Schizosaccharomyces japonicus yFS275]|uniref:2',3'-cyclic-nucleotide 3'-phosphodiesterase n=1 Tax=Schizosaccharomyces japonicus (strain yFS275 / FY16936) TaxID=402676 RepID=B6JXW6_SCHJY|nr:2',3'-cyclic-nucleotide 3'-phosphodiesterase [Schizosaccharomyces japonicus yFS275]EEB06384.1 2',3'-cyclic-nucleotide 3'-phosphodiesterase [Schizosaccharomyces japonicus yFS275]
MEQSTTTTTYEDVKKPEEDQEISGQPVSASRMGHRIVKDDHVHQHQTYTVWLVPQRTSELEERCRRLVTWSENHRNDFENLRIPTAPHITLATDIHVKEGQTPLSILESIVDGFKGPVEVKTGKLCIGDSYYKRVHLEVKKTPTLCELAKRANAVSDSVDPDYTESYKPYMPLLYADNVLADYSTSAAVSSFSGEPFVWGDVAFIELVRVSKHTHLGKIAGSLLVENA